MKQVLRHFGKTFGYERAIYGLKVSDSIKAIIVQFHNKLAKGLKNSQLKPVLVSVIRCFPNESQNVPTHHTKSQNILINNYKIFCIADRKL